MKKDMQLLRAMSEIRPQYIADAGEKTAIPSSIPVSWKIGGGIAIAACIAGSVAVIFPGAKIPPQQPTTPAETTHQALLQETTAVTTTSANRQQWTIRDETVTSNTAGTTTGQTTAQNSSSHSSESVMQSTASVQQTESAAQTTSAKQNTSSQSAAATSSQSTTETTTTAKLPYHDVVALVHASDNPYYYLFDADEREPSWDFCRFEQIGYRDMLNFESTFLNIDNSEKHEAAEESTYFVDAFWLLGQPSTSFEEVDWTVLNLIFELPESSYQITARSLTVDSEGVLHAALAAYDNSNHDGKTASYQISVIYHKDELPEIKKVETDWIYFIDTVEGAQSNAPVYQRYSPVYQQFRDTWMSFGWDNPGYIRVND